MSSERPRSFLARLRATAIPEWRHGSPRRVTFFVIALALLGAMIAFAPTRLQILPSTPVVQVAVIDTRTTTVAATPYPTETALPSQTPPITDTRIPAATAAIALTPTFTPTASPIPFYPTLTPKPRPSITPTATPHDFEIEELGAEETRMVHDGLYSLRNCAPPMYDYVRSHVDVVKRGMYGGLTAYVYTGMPVVYLPVTGTINDPKRYRDSLRTYVAAIVLAHEARHIEMGRETTEPDAYAFTLPLLEPCKPNDIGDENTAWDWRKGYDPYLAYKQFRQYQEWRATLPYPGEPPPGVTPPPLR